MQRGKRLIILGIIALIISCGGKTMLETGQPLTSLESFDRVKLQQLSQTRFYFGHMSVGSNILEGIANLNKKYDLNLKITESGSPAALDQPGMIHSRVGVNENPASKLADFTRFITAGLGDKADLAGVKFCYVDLTEKTDVEKWFTEYQNGLARLKEQYPGTTFIHFTAPLTSPETGIKALVKKVLGKSLRGFADNLNRQHYNELIRQAYLGKEPVFDLALVEATAADGTRLMAELEGEKFYVLQPAYTDDGGHLNATGQQVVAEQLLLFLAELAAKQ